MPATWTVPDAAPAAPEGVDAASAAPEGAAPLDAALFRTLLDPLGPFETAPALAVAVSGGPDSLALALLARDWAAARGGSLLALVVDHGLRPGSAEEAARVAGWLEGLGVPCRRLAWTGTKPRTGLMAAARAARYGLFESACRESGILHLLAGHHRGDQAETLAMRAEAGSGPFGLAGIATIVCLPHVRLLRPLLPVPKARLIATLEAHGLPWLADPSNVDPRFWRGRFRSRGGGEDALLHDRRALAADRREAEAMLLRLLADHAHVHPLGRLALPLGAFAAAPPPVRRLFLARALAMLGGSGVPPGLAALDTLAAALQGGPRLLRATLGGCLLSLCRGRLSIRREPGRIAHVLPLAQGAWSVWDNRFALLPLRPGLVARPLGRLSLKPDGPPADLRATLPVIAEGTAGLPLQLGPAPLGGGRIVARVRFRPRGPLLVGTFAESAVATIGENLI